MQVRVLRWAVVTPNDCAVNVARLSADFVCQDADCTVVVQTSHGGELTRIQVRRVTRSDQSVGIRGVTHHQYLNVLRRVVIQSFTLCAEDLSVAHQQIRTLHTRSTGFSTNQERDVGILKSVVRVISSFDTSNQRESTVDQFHDDAFKRTHRRGNLDQLQNDRLVRTQQFASSDFKQDGVTDSSGSTGNRYANGLLHAFLLERQDIWQKLRG